MDKDREERRSNNYNIIIKGIKIFKDLEKDLGECKVWAAELIKKKVGVKCRVVSCKESRTLIFVKLKCEEVKKEVMKSKYRLKNDKIFIENNLSWEERKVQEKINRWIKEQKGKGLEIKKGLGRVRVKGIWRPWVEVESEEKRKMNGKKRKREGNG